MHKLTFFPLGNADCCLIDLENGKKILFDYANTRNPDDTHDLRCDLPAELLADLKKSRRKDFDIVAITHLDEDHYQGVLEFFWLEHAGKYQDKDRIKIINLWVPAAVITEKGPDKEEARIIQKEARYRFKRGEGIRVFSRPDRLNQWCEDNGIKLKDRLHLITDAGNVAPELKKEKDGVEFFVHSPFAKRLDENKVEDRNDDSLVMQAVFLIDGIETKVMLMADISYELISDIVEVTRDLKARPERLEWDVLKLPHHCSYLSIGPDKGEDKTKPIANVKWLYEKRGQDRCIIISSSNPIPYKDTEEDKDDNPPHRQAANYYMSVVKEKNGQFLVTMEEPKKSDPKPIIIEINGSKAKPVKKAVSGVITATTTQPPRAG